MSYAPPRTACDDAAAALRNFAADSRREGMADRSAATRDARNARTLGASLVRARGRESMVPQTAGLLPHRENAHGGGTRRMVAAAVGPHREDGSTVPLGYARLEYGPSVNPANYVYYNLPSGWRVAVPRAQAGAPAVATLGLITRRGAQAAGYVRVGDTLVPAKLSPGDRRALAQATVA